MHTNLNIAIALQILAILVANLREVYYKGYVTKLYESMNRCKILKLVVGLITIYNYLNA
jgi:hypothetical protein